MPSVPAGSPLRPHPMYPLIERRVMRLRDEAVAWSGKLYRSVTPAFARADDLVSGVGSQLHGGRWNPPGIATVYGSMTPETAMAESLSHARYFRLPIGTSMPRVFVELGVRLKRMLDLRDGSIRQRLRIGLDRLLADDWRQAMDKGEEALTRAVGRAVFAAGLEGMLVMSAVDPKGFNGVYFPMNLGAGSGGSVAHPQRLSGLTDV